MPALIMSDNAILPDIVANCRVRRLGEPFMVKSAASNRVKFISCAVKCSAICAPGGLRSMQVPAYLPPSCYSAALKHKIWWLDAVRNFPRPDPVTARRRVSKHATLLPDGGQRDLFGGASLIREWGRIGRSGQVRIDHHPDEGRAVDALADLVTAKRKRGYR